MFDNIISFTYFRAFFTAKENFERYNRKALRDLFWGQQPRNYF